MSRATLLVDDRRIFEDGAFASRVIYSVPEPVSPSLHTFKYRLAYVFRGECIIRYDNERGKGDHLHRHGTEEPYVFLSLEQLLADFAAEVTQERRAHNADQEGHQASGRRNAGRGRRRDPA